MLRRLLITTILLAVCAQAQEQTPRWQTLDQPRIIAAEPAAERKAGVDLQINPQGPTAAEALEIGIAVFNPGVSGDAARDRKQGVFPEIREAEARYLPYAIRRTLVDSNQWGAVRVLPGTDPGYELLLTGKILVSDGATLSLQLTARDSRDRVWVDKTYTVTADENAYQVTERRLRRPFQDLYNEVANDLLQYRQTLGTEELDALRNISELRYATSLLPDAFAGYLSLNEDSIYQLDRLPAVGDPMMERVNRIREQEYLFIDTTDDQYAELYTEMTPVYDLWRQYQREQVIYRDSWETRLAERDKPPSGSYQAMKQNYNNYKWEKIQRREMKILAQGFDNEIAPTTLDLEGTVINLSGSLDERYREWRKILRRIYSLETGV